MSFFGLLFWIAVFWLVLRWWQRSGRCVPIGQGSSATWGHGPGRYRTGADPSYDTRQEYIESLESRVSELEERLDFTERLLASREPSSAA